jgi:flagellar protein FliS
MRSDLRSYQSVTAYTSLAEASPYQVIRLLLDAALSRIAEARGHMERGEIAAKGEKIGKALGIVEALIMGLDMQRGGEIAANLGRLYDYMLRTLLKANLENRPELLQEVAALIGEVKQGWDAIPPEQRHAAVGA